MDDVWFGTGLTHRDVDTIVRALSLRENRPAPLLAVADRGSRLVLASRALFRFFGAEDVRALSGRLLTGRDPGARRLAALCQNLAINGAPRLERLRFSVGPASEVVTFLCRRILLDGSQPLFIAAALGLSNDQPLPEAAAGPSGALGGAAQPALAVAAAARSVNGALAHGLPLPEAASVAEAPQQGAPASAPPEAVSRGAIAEEPSAAVAPETQDEPAQGEPVRDEPAPALPAAGQVEEALRARWPGTRTLRFLWQTDGDLACTRISPTLADVVGAANADLLGRDLRDVAGRLDPSGRLAAALASRTTWSGIDVAWPVAAAAAAVEVALGGSPAFNRDRSFDGFRGYGVIRLDRVAAHDAVDLRDARPAPAEAPAQTNVVAFPGVDARALSPRDREAFHAIGVVLRDRVESPAAAIEPATPGRGTPEAAATAPAVSGPDRSEPAGTARDPAAVPGDGTPPESAAAAAPVREEALPAPAPTVPDGDGLATEQPAPVEPRPAQALRAAEAARNGLALLDRLQVALLVSRNNVPIFANRHMLDLTGFADEDELHAAGGLVHLFGGLPGNNSGGEVVGVRGRDGSVVFTTARMQQVEWDGLPATLLTLKEGGQAPAPQAATEAATEAVTAQAPADQAPDQSEGAGRLRDGGEVRALRAILEAASDGVAVIDADGIVLSLNRSGEALFGRREVVGKPFLDLVARESQAAVADDLAHLRQGAAPGLSGAARELTMEAGPGAGVPVVMTLGRLGSGDEAAGAARFCALFRDLTPPSPERLPGVQPMGGTARAGASRTDLLAGVAQEIRTPLDTISQAADVMAEERFGPLGNVRYREHLGDIRTAAATVGRLLHDLLELSKLEAGRADLAFDALDVNRIVGEAVTATQTRASRERVIMRLSLAANLPPVKADGRSLRQVVLNVLANAVAFNEPGGQVIVASAVTEAGGVAIRVRDTGPGMSEAEISAALEPFGQVGTGKAGSSGLNLPLAKALATANGATLAIRSRSGQGTMIEVLFPRERVIDP